MTEQDIDELLKMHKSGGLEIYAILSILKELNKKVDFLIKDRNAKMD